MTREQLDVCMYALAMARVHALTLAATAQSFEAHEVSRKLSALERQYAELYELIATGKVEAEPERAK